MNKADQVLESFYDFCIKSCDGASGRHPQRNDFTDDRKTWETRLPIRSWKSLTPPSRHQSHRYQQEAMFECRLHKSWYINSLQTSFSEAVCRERYN